MLWNLVNTLIMAYILCIQILECRVFLKQGAAIKKFAEQMMQLYHIFFLNTAECSGKGRLSDHHRH